MATTVHKYGLLSSLIDLVDEQWAQETLPDDGEAVPALQAYTAFAGSRLVVLCFAQLQHLRLELACQMAALHSQA